MVRRRTRGSSASPLYVCVYIYIYIYIYIYYLGEAEDAGIDAERLPDRGGDRASLQHLRSSKKVYSTERAVFCAQEGYIRARFV